MLKQIFIITISIFTCIRCSSPNDRIYTKIENDIKDSIKKNNAKKFEYTDFILYPQKSYFVNSKLKLLILKSSGEMCDSESYYLFDSKSDSVIYTASRTLCFENPERWKKTSNTVYISNYLTKIEEKYETGKLVKKEKLSIIEDFSFIYEIKNNTEKKHNSR